ncbi:hypothetical protein Tco_1281758 [Tanacetum coccineum]
MANIRTCNKHNMIACVDKTEHNADFHQIVDYLSGCSINYSWLVDPDLIEETIRADLLSMEADGIDCAFQSNPQWKYLVHVLLHCLSPKSTSWEQFGTNMASALVGLATNQKFNFSLMIMNGMLGHISNGTPFLIISPKFSGRITPLTPPMLEVITALAAEEAHSASPHSKATSSPRDAQGTPTQSAAQDSSLQGTADFQGTAEIQGTADFQGTAETQGAADIPQSPNDYTPPMVSNIRMEMRDLSEAYEKEKRKQKKKVSSVKLGRNKDESNLSEENNDQDDHTAFVYEDFDATDAVTPDLERKSDETEERKSDETEEVIIEEEKDTSDVKSGDTEELDLERIQSTARQSTVTPRTLNFDDETGPSSPIRSTQEEGPEEQFKDDEFLADILLNRSRGLSIPKPKKKKLTLQQIRALETAHDEEIARKVQEEWNAEEERKRLEDLKKPKPKTISKKSTSLAQERTQMMSFLKGQGYKNLQKLKYPQMKELYDKVQESIKDSFKDFIPMGSEKEKQMLQERDAKRLLRKRKATIFFTEITAIKELKLRTKTMMTHKLS